MVEIFVHLGKAMIYLKPLFMCWTNHSFSFCCLWSMSKSWHNDSTVTKYKLLQPAAKLYFIYRSQICRLNFNVNLSKCVNFKIFNPLWYNGYYIVCTTCFNIKDLRYCLHVIFMYLDGSQNKQQFFFLTAVTCWSWRETEGVFIAVGIELLKIVQMKFML